MAAEVKKEIQLEIGHVLFIDVVGYSKLSIDEQHAAIEELTEIVRASEQVQRTEAGGRLLKVPAGDGMALVFYTSPEAPAQCAVEINQALKDHPRLRLRMGIHSGPVSGVVDVTGRANVAGAGINMAQRVMDCGDAGHILLSKRVGEDLGEYERWRPLLHDLGSCQVKHGVRLAVVNLHGNHVGNPRMPNKFRALKKRSTRTRWAAVIAALLTVAVVVTGIAIFSRYRGRTALAAPEKSIAVLPFESMSEDKANEYFADGIQDEILTLLSKIADLKVISRTSTQQYTNAPANLPQIAKQLGVAHILEGSVQKSGDTVRVNVQLIKAATDAHLWAETFDRKLTDIFSVESEVARTIADHLRAKLTGQEEQIIAAKPTDNVEAYDAYLRGLAFNLKTTTTPVNSLGAQKYLREAVRLDSKFASAWALLAYVNSRGYLQLTLQPTDALREEARTAAETAMTLRPNLGEAILAKGYYHYACLKDYDTAVLYFERARQYLPNSSRIPELLAYVTRRRGQWDESENYFNEAEKFDPRNVSLLTQHAQSYGVRRQFPEALRKLDQILDIIPDDLDILVQKAAYAQAEGDLPRASALLAPLHPPAGNSGALETQVYQAILERHPAPVISRLKEILVKPDSGLGYLNGELRFWLGWAQDIAGDRASAQETWKQARNELESFLKEQPENFVLIGDLALTNAVLGDKATALSLAERAMTAMPLEKDAMFGPMPIEILARVASQSAEPDRAIPALQKLLSIPSGSPLASNAPLTAELLRLDPMFDPIRNDSAFQKLATEKLAAGTKSENANQ